MCKGIKEIEAPSIQTGLKVEGVLHHILLVLNRAECFYCRHVVLVHAAEAAWERTTSTPYRTISGRHTYLRLQAWLSMFTATTSVPRAAEMCQKMQWEELSTRIIPCPGVGKLKGSRWISSDICRQGSLILYHNIGGL